MSDLLQTLLKDGEQFAEHELPSLGDVARMFKPLVARLESELPALAEKELGSLIGVSSAAPAPAAEEPATAIQTQPAPEALANPDLTPQERAAKLRAEADALDAATETPAQKLRREADEAEAAEIQAQATAGTAAGAQGGAVASDAGQVRTVQDSGQS